MKKALLPVSVILFCAGVFAQSGELPKIAVYVTGDLGKNESRALGTEILDALVKSGRYTAVERSEAFVAEIDREMVTQHGGSVDDDQISVLGKRFGVQYICVADVAAVFDAHQMSARVLDVETAQVMFVGRAGGTLNSLGALMVVSNTVVNNMFSNASETKAQETVRRSEPVSKAEPEPMVIADQPITAVTKIDMKIDGFTPKQLRLTQYLNGIIPGSGSLIVQQDYIGTAVGGGIGITGLILMVKGYFHTHRFFRDYYPYREAISTNDGNYFYRSLDDFLLGSDDRVSEKEMNHVLNQVFINLGIGTVMYFGGSIYGLYRPGRYKKPVPKTAANNESSRNFNFAVIPDVNGSLKAYTLYNVEF